MNIRTCPYCKYKYSIVEYLKKLLFKYSFSEWDCQNCNKKITFNPNRRGIVALTFGGLYILISVVLSMLKNHIDMTPVKWIGLVSIYTIGAIFIFTFDTFKKTD
jgi:CXXC-20-CXXC protein